MKIALIGSAHPFRGGLASYNERLAREFRDKKHDITIYTFTLQYPGFLFPGQSQYSSEPKPTNLKIVECINSINPMNWLRVGKMIRKTQPDLIVIKYWLPFMGPCFGTILRTIKRKCGAKVICIIDNIIPHESRPGDKIFTQYFVKPVDAFIAMSEIVLKDIDHFDKVKPRLYSPHPVFDNFGEIQPRNVALDRLKLDPQYRYILFFGLIRDYKGLDLLIEAFADPDFRNRDLKLIIAGEYYTDKKTYQDLIDKYQLNSDIIQLDKFIPDSEVADIFNACDLVVQPYKSATQSGVTQIAYHFNKPMVVTDVGGLREMCPDGLAGYVVDPDPKEIANAIVKYFDHTDKDKMTANIVEIKKKYSWDVMAGKIFTLYENLKTK